MRKIETFNLEVPAESSKTDQFITVSDTAEFIELALNTYSDDVRFNFKRQNGNWAFSEPMPTSFLRDDANKNRFSLRDENGNGLKMTDNEKIIYEVHNDSLSNITMRGAFMGKVRYE